MSVRNIALQLLSADLLSNSLDRHRDVWIAMQLSLFIIGCMFWRDSMTGAEGFAEETWGEFAYSFPAAMWAAVLMGSSSMIIIGLLDPIKNWMVFVGSSIACINFALLSYSAVFTNGVVVVGLYASVFFLPLHMWLFVESMTRDR